MTTFRIPIPPINAAWEDETVPVARLRPQAKARSMHGLTASPFWLSLDSTHAHFRIEQLPSELLTKLCSSTKKAGGTFIASGESLADISLRDLPKRIESIYPNAMPSIEAVESADGLILQLYQPQHDTSLTSFANLGIAWPIDVSSLPLLAKKLEMLRRLTKSTIPIGVALPVQAICEGDVGRDDYNWLADLPLDFAVLRTAKSCLPKDHTALEYLEVDPAESAACFRRMLSKADKDQVSLFIDYPWRDGYQAAATVLAGADGVLIDRYLTDRGPSLHEMLVRMDAGAALGLNLPKTSVDLLMEQTAFVNRLRDEWDIASLVELFAEQYRSVVELVG